MKKIVNYTALFLFIATLFFACDDFVEKDIENETISLLAPGNNLTTVQLTHTFWWDWLEGAEVYNMQIVEGTFSSVTSFVLDTTVSKNKFDVTLHPGSFQWRVRGENNGGVTDYSTFNLTIDSTMDISSLQIILTGPTDNDTINYKNVTLSWGILSSADDYQIEAYDDVWGGNLVFGPQVVSATSLAVTFPEGNIIWGVQGRNATTGTSTAFSTRTLVIDTIVPNAPNLLLPADNSTLSNVYNTFTWTQGTNTGTPQTDMIYFYDDVAASNLIRSAQAPGELYIDSLYVDTFYWAVQTTDAAGNIGAFSNLRKVILQ